jgi:hypothetical protein
MPKSFNKKLRSEEKRGR